MPKIILYIATSEDGFIADEQGGVDWLPQPEDLPEIAASDSVGYQALLRRINTLFMGSRSYLQTLSFGPWAWPEKTTYVFTSQDLSQGPASVHFVQEAIPQFMEKFSSDHKEGDIWLFGGAELTSSFAALNLIDEIQLTIIPKKIHNGIKLEIPYDQFNVDSIKHCGQGIIQKIGSKKC